MAALGPSLAANLDPSHFFWMGMDGHKVAAALGDRIGHVHGKDTVFHAEQPGPERPARPALAGARRPDAVDLRGARPGSRPGLVGGAGPGAGRLAAQVISIEHEDPFVPATTGVPEAARLLRAAIDDAALEPV